MNGSVDNHVTVIKVCLLHGNRDSWDYLPGDCKPVIGARVMVPFRNKIRMGVVMGEGVPEKPGLMLKTICKILDTEALLSTEMMALCQWIGSYYQSPQSEVLPLALPKKLRQGAPAVLPVADCYHLAISADLARILVPKQAKKQLALIDALAEAPEPVSKKTLAGSGFKHSQLEALLALGVVTCSQQPDLPDYRGRGDSMALALNDEQARAVATINNHRLAYHCFLLQGVTGSGKTEVYLQVIAQVLASGRQVLILVPEIGLTPQLLSRFSARFPVPMAVIHSHLNDTERSNAWLAARANQVKLVIGTRAAIFTPMPQLGLIVIDEEHDSSLKQMDGVRYFARDCALVRAQQANIPVILGSATPSLESVHNCRQKKYSLLRLTQKALASAPLQYQLIDLRNNALQDGLATPTLTIIGEHVQQGNQVLVFINRRGFAPVLLCHACGWMVDCRACDSHLTLHRKANCLCCHHCGLNQAIPQVCKQCQGKELIPVGAGTQRLYEYLQQQFPNTAMLRMDRDKVRKKHELDACLERINKGEVQLIVGTQMLAKGHHFPKLTLVVVVDADAGFYNQDFRALEQLGQLLTQVAGRAGRAEHQGRVLIQTHLPHHPLLNTLIQQGYDAFSNALLLTRQQALLPPYHYLAVIRAEDRQHSRLLPVLQMMKEYLLDLSIDVLGPAPAPLARKANQYRMQLLLKSASRKKLQAALTAMRDWLTINKQANTVRWNVDVDPQDLS